MAAKKPAPRKPSRRVAAPKSKSKAPASKARPKSSAGSRSASSRSSTATAKAKKAVAAKASPAVQKKVTAPKAVSPPKAAVRANDVRSPAPVHRSAHPRALPMRPLPTRRSDQKPVKSSVGLIHGIPPYQAKSGETYMNDRQLEHFRQILLAWKRELMEEVDRTVHHMQDEASNFPDPNDRATQESEFGLELRTRDRERKLLKKIDSAIERIDNGEYGYCEETGEEIGLRRLEARPVATLSVEAQERRELAERQFRDREDGN